MNREKHPAITQDEERTAYITNIQDGTIIGYKYFTLDKLETISVEVKATDNCILSVKTDMEEKDIAVIEVNACDSWTHFCANVDVLDGTHALYFVCKGKGKLKFKSFQLN